jgi:hypothetical protein
VGKKKKKRNEKRELGYFFLVYLGPIRKCSQQVE